MMEGEVTQGGEQTIQYTDDVLSAPEIRITL